MGDEHNALPGNPKAEAVSASDLKARRASILVAEFNSVKAEISARSTIQAGLLTLNITTIGVISGFAFSKEGTDTMILLLMPILSPMLGMLWIDHDINIRSLGSFIEGELKRALEAAADAELPSYQATAREETRNTRWRMLGLGLPVALVFGVLPFLALIYAVFSSRQTGSMSFWAPALIGLIFVVLFSKNAVSVFRNFSSALVGRTGSDASNSG